MFKNYLKIALRLFWKNKIYVAINLSGLSFALACCIVSYLNYTYRANFDASHTNTENIYRVNTLRKIDGNTQPWGITPAPIGTSILTDIPGVQRMARIYSQNVIVKKNEHIINETIYFTDRNLFNFFHFPLAAGSYDGFEERNTILISEALAFKYFGKESSVGQQLKLLKNGKTEVFTIKGLLGKIPRNSSFQFDIIASFNNALVDVGKDLTDWRNAPLLTTFVEIKNKPSVASITSMLDRYTTFQNQLHADWKVEGFYLQPFQQVALSSDIDFADYVHGSSLNSNPRGVGVFVPAIMSALILLIACFNFTNISIASAGSRLKEIGVRKVMGGRRVEMIKQFLTENVLMCLVASFVSVLLVTGILPLLNSQSGIELQCNLTADPGLLILVLLTPIITALIAGLYPAFYISSFKPVGILKGITRFGPKSPFTRMLLFVQFSISSLALIIGIALSRNADYQDKADYGYAINDLVVTEVGSEKEFALLNNLLRNNRDIAAIGGTVQQVGVGTGSSKVSIDDKEATAQSAAIGGQQYLETMNIQLLQGRHFFEGELDTKKSVIVNTTLINELHISEPLGKQLKVDSQYYTVVGVVADYKEFGLHGKVPPCVLLSAVDQELKYLVVRANAGRLPDVQQAIRKAWRDIATDRPYNGFLQSEVTEKEKYMNDGLRSVSFFLAAIIIILSASGLFALVSLNILRRSKEVGIRKVLGASVPYLMRLVSRDFILLITAAFTIGSLVAFVIIDKLIFGFIYAYHPELGMGSFMSALGIIASSCLATVGWKVYVASSSNPMNVLRKQ